MKIDKVSRAIGIIGLVLITISSLARANGFLSNKLFGILSCIGAFLIFIKVQTYKGKKVS